MMTKEEVAQVIAYCDENKISYKQRLSELGISPWNFYDAKRKYAPKEEEEKNRLAICLARTTATTGIQVLQLP